MQALHTHLPTLVYDDKHVEDIDTDQHEPENLMTMRLICSWINPGGVPRKRVATSPLSMTRSTATMKDNATNDNMPFIGCEEVMQDDKDGRNAA